jgi:hypothetical protein
MANKRLQTAKTTPTAETAPVDNQIIVDGIDITVPAFLKRDKRLTPEQIIALCGTSAQRTWAPIRSKEKIAATPKAVAPIFVTNDMAPVAVMVAVKSSEKPRMLAQYANMADFKANHSLKDYPYSREESNKDITIIHCRAAMWAPMAAPTTQQPTRVKSTLRAQKTNDVAGRILALMPEGGGSRKVIQTALEADGMDKTMLDNSLGGRLDRLVREGKLTKGKVGNGVLYQLVGAAPVAAAPAEPAQTLAEKLLGTFPAAAPVAPAAPAKPAKAAKVKAEKKKK